MIFKVVLAWVSTLALLSLATIAYFFVSTSSEKAKAVGVAVILYDPLYWIVALAVVGVALWLFRRWAFAY